MSIFILRGQIVCKHHVSVVAQGDIMFCEKRHFILRFCQVIMSILLILPWKIRDRSGIYLLNMLRNSIAQGLPLTISAPPSPLAVRLRRKWKTPQVIYYNMVFRFETFGAVFSTQIPCNSVQSPIFRTKF